jgi:hypothetical protein
VIAAGFVVATEAVAEVEARAEILPFAKVLRKSN